MKKFILLLAAAITGIAATAHSGSGDARQSSVNVSIRTIESPNPTIPTPLLLISTPTGTYGPTAGVNLSVPKGTVIRITPLFPNPEGDFYNESNSPYFIETWMLEYANSTAQQWQPTFYFNLTADADATVYPYTFMHRDL